MGDVEDVLQMLKIGDANAVLDWKKAVLESLAELESPRITKQMMPHLLRTEIIEALIGIVTRRASTSVEVVEGSTRDYSKSDKFRWRRTAFPEGLKEMAFEHRSFESGSTSVPANCENDGAERAARKRSYNVMSLLCGLTQQQGYMGQGAESFHAANRMLEVPSEEVLQLLHVAAPSLVAYLLDAFHPESSASLYHVCKILDVMLRFECESVLASLVENKKALEKALEDMLHYIHYPCVSDLLLILCCPVPRNQEEVNGRRYSPTPQTRDSYITTRSSMNILLMVAKHIWVPFGSEAHKAAAAELLECLVQKYAGLNGCSEVLSALVRSPELLANLIKVACGEEVGSEDLAPEDEWLASSSTGKTKSSSGKKKTKSGKKGKKGKANKGGGSSKKVEDEDDGEEEQEEEIDGHAQGLPAPAVGKEIPAHALQRDAALDTLRCVIDLSTQKQVANSEPKPYTSFTENAANLIENQMLGISERLHNILDSSFDVLCRAMSDPSSFSSQALGRDVKHSIYVVKNPFSNYRLELIKVVITCIAHKPRTLLRKVSNEHWKTLTQWFLEYPHCNLYHVEFKELFMTLLRNEDASSPQLFYVLDQCNLIAGMIARFSDEERRKRESVSGPILVLCNALRLQAQAVSPDHALCTFLRRKDWEGFQPLLVRESLKLVPRWPVSKGEIEPSPVMISDKRLNEFSKLSKGPASDAPSEAEINLGSDFAAELGFADVVAYDPSVEAATATKKKAGKKGKK